MKKVFVCFSVDGKTKDYIEKEINEILQFVNENGYELILPNVIYDNDYKNISIWHLGNTLKTIDLSDEVWFADDVLQTRSFKAEMTICDLYNIPYKRITKIKDENKYELLPFITEWKRNKKALVIAINPVHEFKAYAGDIPDEIVVGDNETITRTNYIVEHVVDVRDISENDIIKELANMTEIIEKVDNIFVLHPYNTCISDDENIVFEKIRKILSITSNKYNNKRLVFSKKLNCFTEL